MKPFFFCIEQVTLLFDLGDLLEGELKEDTFVTDEMHLTLPRETNTTLERRDTSLFQRVPVWKYSWDGSFHSLWLRRSLNLFKSPCCSEHGFRYSIATELLSIGFIRLCLELLKDLGPPELIQNAIEKHGEAEWTTRNGRLNLSTSNNPYKGYRKDIVAIVANVSYKNRFVQGEIWRHLGDLPLIPYQCVNEKDNPFLRDGS